MKVFLSVVAVAIVGVLIVMGVLYFDGADKTATPPDTVSSSEISPSGVPSPAVSSSEGEMAQDASQTGGEVAAGASMAGGAPLTDGKALYTLYCSKCHDPGARHPGTMMLHQLGQPADEAALLDHKDLDPDYVRSIVRNGLIEMPPFRPSEISDSQLDALVHYLTQPHSQ